VCVCGVVSFLNGKCLQHVGLDGCMQCMGVFFPLTPEFKLLSYFVLASVHG